jgi:hypothetical protein
MRLAPGVDWFSLVYLRVLGGLIQDSRPRNRPVPERNITRFPPPKLIFLVIYHYPFGVI